MDNEELIAYYRCKARTTAYEKEMLKLQLARARQKNRAHRRNIRSMQKKLELLEAKLALRDAMWENARKTETINVYAQTKA